MAEWWPSSAKLAANRAYDRDHHAPHWADVMVVLQEVMVPQPRLSPYSGPVSGELRL